MPSLIASPRCLDRQTLRRSRVGQRYWWLRRDGVQGREAFVPLPSFPVPRWRQWLTWLIPPPHSGHRADLPIAVLINLPRGDYTLGCGPRPEDGGIRIPFRVHLDAEVTPRPT